MNAPRQTALQVAYPGSRGLTLVEILIALVILSIGLLGLAGLQTLSLQYNTGAWYRTQATALAYGMADRMRANRQAALDGLYNIDFEAAPACGVPDTSGTVIANDIAGWQMTLACRLPDGQGAITRVAATDEFTFTVRWDERGKDDPMVFEFKTAL